MNRRGKRALTALLALIALAAVGNGSEDGALNRDELAAVRHVVQIAAGNHARFGN